MVPPRASEDVYRPSFVAVAGSEKNLNLLNYPERRAAEVVHRRTLTD